MVAARVPMWGDLMRPTAWIVCSLMVQTASFAQTADQTADLPIDREAVGVEQALEGESIVGAQEEDAAFATDTSDPSEPQNDAINRDVLAPEDVAQHASQSWEGMAAGDQNSQDDQRLVLQDRGFSISPPSGWEVITDHPTLSVFMQIPAAPGLRYRRNIQVASYKGPRFIDDMTAKEFETEISRTFASAPANIQNQRIRNHLKINLMDGRPALLFYTEMVVDGVELMQARILASSVDRHYLTIFTDVREHFEDEAASNKFFTEAWRSMVSLEIAGPTPLRFAWLHRTGWVFAGLVIFLVLIWVLRRWRARRALLTYSEDLGEGSLPENGSSNLSQLSRISAAQSLPTSAVRPKKRKKSKSSAWQDDSQSSSAHPLCKPTVSGTSLLTTGGSRHLDQRSEQLPSGVRSRADTGEFSGFDDDDKAAS